MSYALDQIAGFAPPSETLTLKDFINSGWEPLPERRGRISGESETRNTSAYLIPKQPTLRTKKFDVNSVGVISLVNYVTSMLPKNHNVEVTIETHPRRLVVILSYGEGIRRFASSPKQFKVATCVPRSVAKKYRNTL
jgi:hypothetical protein